MQPDIVIHINAWLLLSFSVAGFIIFTTVIWKLLMHVSKLTIAGIYQRIELYQTDLEAKIDSVQSRADSCCERVGRVEHTLIQHGVKAIAEKT